MYEKLLTIQQVANLLGVSTKTLRRWDQRGRFVATRTVGNQRRYTQSQIDKFRSSTKNAQEVPQLFSETEAPKELKATHALPSILSGLPSGSILRNHFLLKHKDSINESVSSSENPEKPFEPASFARPGLAKLNEGDPSPLRESKGSGLKVNSVKMGFMFASLVLILSLAGTFVLTKYNVVAGLSAIRLHLSPLESALTQSMRVGMQSIGGQAKEQFAKFINNLARLRQDFGGQARDLSFVPQDIVGGVLAAATGGSDLVLNINIPTFFSQNVGIGTATPDTSAILDLVSEEKGFLAPRMTTVQRDAIASPATGLFVYNTDTNQYNMYNGTSWGSIGGITAIGDVTTGGAFTETGTLGTALYFYDADGRGKLTTANLTGVRTYTLPDATGEVSLLGQTISNAELVNSKVTVSPGTNMTGGGEVALGSSITLTLKDSISLAGTLTVAGDTTLTGDIAVNGGDITTSATTFNLVNATATTVNFAQAATALTMGATTGTATIRNATLDLPNGSATISGNLTLYGAARSIQTTSNNSLTLGGSNTGNITLSPLNGSGTLALNVGSLLLNSTAGATGTDLTCVTATNGIVTGIGSCGVGSGGSVWTLATGTGVLYPINNSVDLLIGGTATTSAKFAALNINSGTPTASVSAGAAGGAYLSATGTLATTAKQTLTLGDTNTGEIRIGTDATARTITIGNGTGATALSLTSGTGAQTFTSSVVTGTTTASAFVFADSALTSGTLAYLTSSSLTSGILANLTLTGSSAVATAANSGSLLTLSSTTTGFTGATQRVAGIFVSGANTNASANVQGLAISVTNTGTTSTNTALNLTASGATTNYGLIVTAGLVGIANTTPLTALDVTGSASLSANISLRGSGTAHTFNILDNGTLNFQRSPSGDAGLAALPVLYLGSNGNVGIGNTAPATTLDVTGTGNITTSLTTPIAIGGTGTTSTLTLRSTSGVGVAGADIIFQTGNNGATEAMRILNSGFLGIANTTPLTALDVTGSASLSANISLRGSGTAHTFNILDNGTLNIQRSVGGDAAFAITYLYLNNTGNVGIGNTAPGAMLDLGLAGTTLGVIRFAGNTSGNVTVQPAAAAGTWTMTLPTTGGTANYFLQTNGSGVTTWAAVSSSNWDVINGVITPRIETQDLLIGGTATTSAKFAALNINSGTPTASVSAGAGGAAYINATGTLATTAKQTLTLGDANTGEIRIGTDATARTTTIGNATGATALSLTSGTGSQTFTSSVATGTTTASAFAFADTALTSGTGLYLTSSSLTSGILANLTLTGSSAVATAANSGSLLTLSSTTTGFTGATQRVAGIFVSGANTNASAVVQGLAVSVTNTGTTSTNVGGYFVATGATTSRGLEIAALTSATSTGLTIGALSGTTADVGINIGAISGSGATGGGITVGNISTTGTTNYGLQLGTMTGGTTSNYQITTGILTSATTTTNAQINLGGVVTTGGTTNYGINVGALSGTGTTNYGVNVNTLTSTGTTNYGLNIGGATGAATTNYGILIGAVSGATTNYGLYTTSGTTVLNATSGNVGIGNTTPLTALDVTGSASLSANLSLRGSGTAHTFNILDNGTLNIRRSPGGDAGVTTALLYLSNSGNVGIGNTAPLTALDITGSASLSADLSLRGSSTAHLQNILQGGSLNIQTSAGGDAGLTSRLFLRNDGNVGIGTTTPAGRLHVGTLSTTMAATGGTISISGSYTIHTFTVSGTFTPDSSGTVDYLVVAGGGGGGANALSGGGGAGGMRTDSNFAVTAQAYTVTVGAGGAAGASGSNSVFGSITSTGGGYGGAGNLPYAGATGGSGGGSVTAIAGGAGTAGQGNNGGAGSTDGVTYTNAGGGGGAGAVGVDANSNSSSGNGGAGTASSISGSSVTYAGGGGGRGQAGTNGSGGSGGGGAAGVAGTANTGGGGGGNAAGGSGIVIIRYLTTNPIGTGQFVINSDGNVGIGTTAPLASLDIRPATGTVPSATVSATSSFAALVVNNNGVGDLFTASISGATKFTILNSGDLRFAGQTNFLTTLASAATAARTITFPDVTGTICTSVANCAQDAFWNSSSGALYSGNSTLDLLLGATSTASARFAALNINSGTPTASVSAGAAGGAYLSATGTLATTAKQTLTLGDANTGEIRIGTDATARTTTIGNATGATALALTSGTGSQTFTSSVATGTTTASAFAFADTALTSGTGLYLTSSSLTSGILENLTLTGSSAVATAANSGSLLTLSSTTTGFTGATQRVAGIFVSGANTNASAVVQGLAISVTNTGTTSTNTALSLTASGATTNYGLIVTAGNVGIANTTPLTALDVTGSASLSANLSLRGAGTSHTFNILDNGTLNFQRSPGGDAGLAALPVLYLGSNGNVGIGNTAPATTLDVTGTGNISTSLTTPIVIGGTGTTSTLTLRSTSGVGVAGADIIFQTGNNGATEAMRILNSGFLGIANTTPLTALDVTGSASLSANLSLRGSGTAHTFNILDNGTLNIRRSVGGDAAFATTFLYLSNNGNVGIGNTAPLLRLDVQDSQSATAAAQIYNTNTGTDADGLILKLGNTSTTVVSSTNHFLSFETVGIGIVGSVQGNGGTGVTYATSGIADFAEYFRKDANQTIPFGSVVCLQDNGLAASCDTNNGKIIGVASEKPAFLGGENLGDRSIAVGLVGQVRTRVSSANGAIKIGDPLTISSIPGVAVKATSVGQILGKAIEGFDGQGEGEILVSVNITWYNPSVYVAMDGTLAGITATVSGIEEQLALQGTALVLQGDALQAQIASNATAVASVSASLAAQTKYILENDPLFKDLKDKVSALQSKFDLLSLQFDQQASISGLLAQIAGGQVLGASTSAVLSLGNVELNNATIAQDLMVLGRTTVTDLGVTGNINAGLLAIHGLNGEINTLSGDLYLQKTGLGGVDILAGKVVIDTTGNMTVAGTITAKQIEAENYTVLGQESIGSATIPTGATSIEVATLIASESSKIFLTSTSLTTSQITVVQKSNGKFKVAIPQPTTSPISFDWWIVGNK